MNSKNSQWKSRDFVGKNLQQTTIVLHEVMISNLKNFRDDLFVFFAFLVAPIATSQGVCCCSQGACFSRPLWLFLDPESQSWNGCRRAFCW